MIAPATGEFDVPTREPFTRESRAARKKDRTSIPRLDVDLHAMQAQHPERELERELEPLRHIAAAGEGRERVIADVPALEGAAHDFAQVEYADRRAAGDAADQKSDVRRGLGLPRPWSREARKVGGEACRRRW